MRKFGPLLFADDSLDIREGVRRVLVLGSDGSQQEAETPEIAVTKDGVTVRYRQTPEGILVI